MVPRRSPRLLPKSQAIPLLSSDPRNLLRSAAYKVPYILPSYGYSNSFVFTLFTKLPGCIDGIPHFPFSLFHFRPRLSSLESALPRFRALTPLECAVTKKQGGGGPALTFNFQTRFTRPVRFVGTFTCVTFRASPALLAREISVSPGFSTLGDPPRSPCAPAGASGPALNGRGCASPLQEEKAKTREDQCQVQCASQAVWESLPASSLISRAQDLKPYRASFAERIDWQRSALNSSPNRSKPPAPS